jgi:hypothetical protein
MERLHYRRALFLSRIIRSGRDQWKRVVKVDYLYLIASHQLSQPPRRRRIPHRVHCRACRAPTIDARVVLFVPRHSIPFVLK